MKLSHFLSGGPLVPRGLLLCVIDTYSKYTWVIPLKDKRGITITNAFQKTLDESKCGLNKTWVDKGSDFYNRSMKSFFQDNDIEMYSLHNEGKSVIAERFIRTYKFINNTTIHIGAQLK